MWLASRVLPPLTTEGLKSVCPCTFLEGALRETYMGRIDRAEIRMKVRYDGSVRTEGQPVQSLLPMREVLHELGFGRA